MWGFTKEKRSTWPEPRVSRDVGPRGSGVPGGSESPKSQTENLGKALSSQIFSLSPVLRSAGTPTSKPSGAAPDRGLACSGELRAGPCGPQCDHGAPLRRLGKCSLAQGRGFGIWVQGLELRVRSSRIGSGICRYAVQLVLVWILDLVHLRRLE